MLHIWCPKNKETSDIAPCGFNLMGKFHVRNVNESRDFQYLRVVVLKDVAPCGHKNE